MRTKTDFTCFRWWRLRSNRTGVRVLAFPREDCSSSAATRALVNCSWTTPGRPWALDTTLEHDSLSWSLRLRTIERARDSSCCQHRGEIQDFTMQLYCRVFCSRKSARGIRRGWYLNIQNVKHWNKNYNKKIKNWNSHSSMNIKYNS